MRRLHPAVVALAALAAACTGAEPSAAPPPGRSMAVTSSSTCVPQTTLPAPELGPIPAGLALPEGAGVLERFDETGFTAVQGVLPGGEVGGLLSYFRAEVRRAGHDVESEDDEGHEAEIYFLTAGGGAGAVQMSQARCPEGAGFSITLTS